LCNGLNDSTIHLSFIALVETHVLDLQFKKAVPKVGNFSRPLGKGKLAHGHANLVQSTRRIEWWTVGYHARAAYIAKRRKGHVYRRPRRITLTARATLLVALSHAFRQWKGCLVEQFTTIWFAPCGHFPNASVGIRITDETTGNVKAVGVANSERPRKGIGSKKKRDYWFSSRNRTKSRS
jgi:hypothetical protein